MAVREIPIAYVASKDVLLRLKKEGKYSVKYIKPVTKKEVETAISADENLIEEFKTRVDVEKIKRIDSIQKKYSEIRNTDEWIQLCEAHRKLKEYQRLCNVWTKEFCIEEDAYDEIKGVLEQSFVSKYEKIIVSSIYRDFYVEKNELEYSKDAYYRTLIEGIKKSIEELKEYCLEHPNEIKGNRKGR